MLLMALGPVLVDGHRFVALATAQMRSHALALMEKLDRGGHGADLDHFMDQVVRDAVEVAIEGDVVVDVDSGLEPLAQIEPVERQWRERQLVEGFKQARACSWALPKRPLVELGQQL